MKRQKIILGVLTATVLVGMFFNTSSAKAEAPSEDELIAVITSDEAPKAEKAIACKKLAIFGSPKAVPALEPLLKDEELISWARIALEAIPGEEADAALRGALDDLTGRSLIGVINSIAVRGDQQAVPQLIKILNDDKEAPATAAAAALGRLGGEPAVAALKRALSDESEAVRNVAAEGLVYAAEGMMAEEQNESAIDLYQAIRTADVPKQRKIEATRGLILAQGAAGVPLLVEQLRSDDEDFFRLGLFTARELEGKPATDAIASELAGASPDRAALLLKLLADRGDPVSSALVLEQAQEGPEAVRIAAIELLGKLGDVESVPALLKLAQDENEAIAAAAKAAVAGLPGKEVDALLVGRLGEPNGEALAVVAELTGKRRIADAAIPLMKLLEHPDADVRENALTALGETIAFDQLDVLIQRVVEAEPDDEKPAVLAALKAAAVRMKDREATAQRLAEAMSGKSTDVKIDLLNVLGAMGGPTALDVLSEAGMSDSPELQDAATRLLGEWLDVDAAPALLEMAKSKDHKYRVRALRGYLRLARQFAQSDSQRAEMCSKAFAAADRPEERKLALEVLTLYPSVEGMKVAMALAAESDMKEEARNAALTIASKLIGKNAGSPEVLNLLSLGPVKLEIVKAQYGAGNKQKDVTQVLKKSAKNRPLIVLPSDHYNKAFGGDPVPGTVKELTIQYKMDGKSGTATFAEDAPILLPQP